MTASKGYLSNFLRWKSGRQNSGYEKMLLILNPWLVPFDCYLLRYKAGSVISAHTDPVENKRHYRLNIILKRAKSGGDFECESLIFENARMKLFRPDIAAHSVSKVIAGTRYVFSIGWALPAKTQQLE